MRFDCFALGTRRDGGADEPSWRLQILLQERESTLLNHWKTIGRNSPFDINSKNWKQPDAGVLDVAVRCVSTGDDRDFKLKRVALSDYTDPVWLSFIGSFGQAPIGNPEEYKLKIDKDSKVLALYKGNELQKWHLQAPPLEAKDWKSDDNVNPTFQLLRVYRPIADAARGGLDETAGKLITHLKPKNLPGEFEAWGSENNFDEIMPGDFAYLCSFQRINTNDEHLMPKIDRWEKLMELIFADPEKEECLVRPVPEILGQIEIE